MLEVKTYLSENGLTPFEQWLSCITDTRAKAKIAVRIDRLRLGLFGDCKSVGNGVQELRVHEGQGYRVYFWMESQSIVLLLHGGSKKSQANDIKTAKSYLADYKSRAQ